MKNLKRLTAAVLAVAMTVTAMPTVTAEEYFSAFDVMKAAGAVSEVNAGEESPAEDFEYKVNEDGESVTITKFKGSGGDVVIPSEIEGKKVTSIGGYAFSCCTSLTSAEIPNSVTSIDGMAFSNCTSLTSVAIPNSVTSIGNRAFLDCTSLRSVAIPNSVTSIDYSAFHGCTSLKSVEIPNSVTSIADGTFNGCTSLTSVAIPNNVTSIGAYVFYGCTSLISVTIPNSVTNIDYSAFLGCTSLTSIEIPYSVTYIGDGAFYGCTSLTIYGYENSTAQTYAEENQISFKIMGKYDENSGIIIENPNLEGKTLEAEKSSNSTDDKIIYNITLKDENGKEVQPEGNVTVKIPLPEGWDSEKTTVTHRDKDGKLTDMKAVYENGYMVFVTDHFSEYILAQKPDVQKGELNGDGKITTVDAKWVLQAVSGSRTLTPEQIAAADVNGDGKITTVDAKWILQAVSGSRELE